MRHLAALTISLLLLGGLPARAQKMEVSPNGSRPTAAAPAEYFTGSVLLEPLFGAKDGMPATGGLVTFAPARARPGTLIRPASS
jgi:hypothetical protein